MNWTDLAAALAVGAFIAAIWVIGLWLLSIARRDISIIDAVFTLIEVSIIGIAGVAMGSAPDVRKALIFGLLCLWSIRLTAHLGWRKWGRRRTTPATPSSEAGSTKAGHSTALP